MAYVRRAALSVRKSLSSAVRTPQPLNGVRGICTSRRLYASDIIGVDLGTTNSCVAILEGSKPKVIENSEGMRTTPSVVAFTNDNELLVGVTAKRQGITNAGNTVYATKRLIGRRYDEESTKKEMNMLSYEVCDGGNGDAWVKTKHGKKYSPPQIGGYIINKMKQTAEAYLNTTVSKAVITVPAYFNDSQRQATKDAGKIGGVEVLRIINEPTAAALAYGMDKKDSGSTLAVFDLGGGTFDISILDVLCGVFEVKSTNGNTSLGGEDFDEKVLGHLVHEFKKTDGIDLSKDKLAIQRLREAAETAKTELSSKLKTTVNLPFITADQTGPRHLQVEITRAKLEDLCARLLDDTKEPCLTCLKDANLTKADISEVILVGGMTRMPRVQELVKDIFGRDPSKGVNPDEAVAMGAAIQGGVLKGEIKDLLLLDVAPLSLGIETLGGVFTKIISRNTTIPTKKTQIFSTAVDNQTQVGIKVYQGERVHVVDNKHLGQFELSGIPPSPRGVPQVEVTFDVDANGLMNISALDKLTGRAQQLQITSNGGLSQAEIERMIQDANLNREADEATSSRIKINNEAESLVYAVDKQLVDFKDKITESDKTETETKLQKLKSVMADTNASADEIQKHHKELQEVSWKISQQMYSSCNNNNNQNNQSENTNEEATKEGDKKKESS